MWCIAAMCAAAMLVDAPVNKPTAVCIPWLVQKVALDQIVHRVITLVAQWAVCNVQACKHLERVIHLDVELRGVWVIENGVYGLDPSRRPSLDLLLSAVEHVGGLGVATFDKGNPHLKKQRVGPKDQQAGCAWRACEAVVMDPS